MRYARLHLRCGVGVLSLIIGVSLCLFSLIPSALAPRDCFGFDANEAVRESSNALTITTYSGFNEGHLITFPDSTTMSIDCASGNITTKSHFHADHCADCGSGQYNRNNVSPGQVIYNNGGVTVTVVAANGRVIGQGAANVPCDSGDENPLSMALLVKYRGFDYLTAGDLTSSPESSLGSALAARGVKVDVLKVSHHGSSTSSKLSYLQNILPEYAVVSGHNSSLKADTLQNLKDAGVKITYDTYNDQSDPRFKYSGGNITITTDGAYYYISAPNFSDGPYDVDEYVPPDVIPPHLLVTEVAIDTHRFPESHDWIELYLPPDASAINLDSLYWTDFEEVQDAATATVTLIPGDVVILHDAPGDSENDWTGKGWNGWWDIYVDNVKSNSWNPWDDQFTICSQNSAQPPGDSIIDAVVWSNYDGTVSAGAIADGNYLINALHWGNPSAGNGVFAFNNEGPAMGDINYGYAQRITTVDTNSVLDWTIGPSHSQGIPPPTPAPPPAPPASTPQPEAVSLFLNQGSFAAGDQLQLRTIVQPFSGQPCDVYVVIVGPPGLFSVLSGNRLTSGIVPIVKNLQGLPEVVDLTVFQVAVPANLGGDYNAIIAFVDKGKKVKGLSSAFMYKIAGFSIQ